MLQQHLTRMAAQCAKPRAWPLLQTGKPCFCGWTHTCLQDPGAGLKGPTYMLPVVVVSGPQQSFQHWSSD